MPIREHTSSCEEWLEGADGIDTTPDFRAFYEDHKDYQERSSDDWVELFDYWMDAKTKAESTIDRDEHKAICKSIARGGFLIAAVTFVIGFVVGVWIS